LSLSRDIKLFGRVELTGVWLDRLSIWLHPRCRQHCTQSPENCAEQSTQYTTACVRCTCSIPPVCTRTLLSCSCELRLDLTYWRCQVSSVSCGARLSGPASQQTSFSLLCFAVLSVFLAGCM